MIIHTLRSACRLPSLTQEIDHHTNENHGETTNEREQNQNIPAISVGRASKGTCSNYSSRIRIASP